MPTQRYWSTEGWVQIYIFPRYWLEMFPEILKLMGTMDTFSKIEGCNCTHCTPIAEALDDENGKSLKELFSEKNNTTDFIQMMKMASHWKSNFAPAAEKGRGLVIQKRTILVNRAVGRRTWARMWISPPSHADMHPKFYVGGPCTHEISKTRRPCITYRCWQKF